MAVYRTAVITRHAKSPQFRYTAMRLYWCLYIGTRTWTNRRVQTRRRWRGSRLLMKLASRALRYNNTDIYIRHGIQGLEDREWSIESPRPRLTGREERLLLFYYCATGSIPPPYSFCTYQTKSTNHFASTSQKCLPRFYRIAEAIVNRRTHGVMHLKGFLGKK